ncbi:MAG: hypothetical protein JXR96_16725, partial [Deltaproteobacteria bacterium]|nr:hypothetical protein [Deltaproteobacteria bacterium]
MASGDQVICGDCLIGFHEDETGACVADEQCQADSCHNHGACDVSTGVVTCTCDDGYTGYYCERCSAGWHDDGTGACALDQQCLASSCDAHGQCDESSGLVVCTCDAGYTGDYCDQCDTDYHWDHNGNCAADESCVAADPCGDHGTCDDSSGLIECRCDDGYAGDLCQLCSAGWHDDGTGACALDEQCMVNTCSGHGTCDVTDGEVGCTACDAGYTGEHCESCATDYHINPTTGLCDVDEDCTLADPCTVHGVCHDDTGLIECSCDIGWDGDLCQACAPGYHDDGAGACLLNQQCLANTCSGHGQCNETGGVVTCAPCDNGYTGAWCERCATAYHLNPATGLCDPDETCDGVSCSGHGTCDLRYGLAVCLCNTGYTGFTCETCAIGYHLSGGLCLADESCAGVTCSGHGTCYMQGGVALCACDAGYTGSDCEGCYPGYAVNMVTGLCEIPCEGWGWDAIRCNGTCVSGTSNENCGDCGVVCLGAALCQWDGSNALCICPDDGWHDPFCNGVCTNLAIDSENCGQCGNQCVADPANCKQATCNGAGSCNVPVGTACGATTCSNGWQAVYACDATGTCQVTNSWCNGFACNGSDCVTSCTVDTDEGCLPDYICVDGSQCSHWTQLDGGDHDGEDWTLTDGESLAGRHENIGVFTIPA